MLERDNGTDRLHRCSEHFHHFQNGRNGRARHIRARKARVLALVARLARVRTDVAEAHRARATRPYQLTSSIPQVCSSRGDDVLLTSLYNLVIGTLCNPDGATPSV